MKSQNIFSKINFLFFLASCLFGQTKTINSPNGTSEWFIGPTETRYWDASKANNGYTLFAAMGKTYLIDMEGYVYNQWNIGTSPHLLDNGNLLDASKADPSGFSGFQEVDWNGNAVWSYTEKRSTYSPHHDWTRIFNKKLNAYTTLYIANKSFTREQVLAAGANPASSTYNDVQLDAIVEVDMSGNIVWEWCFFDHIIQDFDATKPNYVGSGKAIKDYPNKININMTGNPLKSDWLHCNSIDYNPTLGHIVINSVQGEFYIIDHDNTFLANNAAGSIALAATNAGDFLYRFGDPYRYGQGNQVTTSSSGHKQIGGAHHVWWIKPGLKGEGNLLIFNNGEYLGEMVSQSYIFEVNPYYNSSKVNTGKYVNPPDAGYYTWTYPNKDSMKKNKFISNQVVWIYNSKNDQNFYSTIGGSEQRLANNNTLICSDTQGHLFEVTYGDASTSTLPQVVWEYICPVTSDGIKRIITDQYPMYNSVFRAFRYLATDAPLVGKTLTKKATITGKTPSYYKPDDLVAGVDNLNEIPTANTLQQNYPNPFNPETVITWQIKSPGNVSLKVYDIMGREVATLVNEYKNTGTYRSTFSTQHLSLASGVYIYQLKASNPSAGSGEGFIESKKMLFIK